jgi:hypothetical protein
VLLTIAGQLCFRAGIRGLVIDPWNELESMKPVQMTETEYVSHVLKRVRIFARQRAVHVRHAHVCTTCSRQFRCTAPSCAEQSTQCISCKLDRIEGRGRR